MPFVVLAGATVLCVNEEDEEGEEEEVEVVGRMVK